MRRLTWVIWLPFAVAPWLGVHCLAYALVPPGSHEYGHTHAAGHAYLVYSAPILAACALTLLLAGVILGVGEGLRARPRPHPPLWLFLLLPPPTTFCMASRACYADATRIRLQTGGFRAAGAQEGFPVFTGRSRGFG